MGFYKELLSFGFNVWACDADAIFLSDPREFVRQHPWTQADIAIATDCIDIPGDQRYPLLHCDFNTGLVYMRSRKAVIDFTDRWRETIASAVHGGSNPPCKAALLRGSATAASFTGVRQFAPFVLRADAKETRIRDQAAFNMMTKLRPLRQHKVDGVWQERIFLATNGGENRKLLPRAPQKRRPTPTHTFTSGIPTHSRSVVVISDEDTIKLGVLPSGRYLNGHTYFVQHAHTLPGALPPISVHMTYQFAEGSTFAYGKRQRLRQVRASDDSDSKRWQLRAEDGSEADLWSTGC